VTWAQIKIAINSLLGKKEFKPIDVLIKEKKDELEQD
jgi:hypothetical protein